MSYESPSPRFIIVILASQEKRDHGNNDDVHVLLHTRTCAKGKESLSEITVIKGTEQVMNIALPYMSNGWRKLCKNSVIGIKHEASFWELVVHHVLSLYMTSYRIRNQRHCERPFMIIA